MKGSRRDQLLRPLAPLGPTLGQRATEGPVTTREESVGMTLVVRRWSRCLSSVRGIAIAGALALPCSAQHVLERISATPAGLPASGWSSDAWITPCGRWIAFDSDATDLIPFDPGINDVFVRDRMFATTSRVSVNTAGQRANNDCESPSLSEDGRIVVFASSATNQIGRAHV